MERGTQGQQLPLATLQIPGAFQQTVCAQSPFAGGLSFPTGTWVGAWVGHPPCSLFVFICRGGSGPSSSQWAWKAESLSRWAPAHALVKSSASRSLACPVDGTVLRSPSQGRSRGALSWKHRTHSVTVTAAGSCHRGAADLSPRRPSPSPCSSTAALLRCSSPPSGVREGGF